MKLKKIGQQNIKKADCLAAGEACNVYSDRILALKRELLIALGS